MSVLPTFADEAGPGRSKAAGQAAKLDQAAVLGAVREDVRQTLRMGWIDPAFDARSAHPAFITAGWSAARPNVGRSFIALTKAIREEAVSTLQPLVGASVLRRDLRPSLSDEELRRVEEVTRAVHVAMPKVQLVVHAMYRAARRERIDGTGREEPPIRRGVPEWQRWMAAQSIAEESRAILEETANAFAVPAPPATFRLMARWPAALSGLWERVRTASQHERWKRGAGQVRRVALRGMGTLPHPVELQWIALKDRGLGEPERLQLLSVMRALDAAMAPQTMIATFAWLAMGAPEIGSEG